MPEEKWEETQVLNHCTLSENVTGKVDSCLKQSISLFRSPENLAYWYVDFPPACELSEIFPFKAII